MMKSISDLYRKRQRKNLTDFRNASEVIKESYALQKTMGTNVTMPYGWPSLDYMSGGMRAGDFVTFVGRPQAGKTFKLLYTAHNAWRMGRPILFISMEMMTTIITQRLAAMHTKKNLTDLIKAELSTKAVTSMMVDLHKLKKAEVPLWVVDGSLIRYPDDIVMLCHQLKPMAVFVDGAYLLDNPDKRLGKWDKQAENARQMKQRIATDLGIPVVASYQLTKGSVKAKKTTKGKEPPKDGMEDVYGSDEMAQLSTVMLGLFDDESEIESKKQRTIKILKGRNGESGSLVINWDFSDKMDFTEILPPEKTKQTPEDAAEGDAMQFMG
jgi:replicative DNA helicase